MHSCLLRKNLQEMCNILCNYPFKNHLLMLMMMFLFLLFNDVKAQSNSENNLPELSQSGSPSKGVVIVVLSIMFAITFLLLAYVKFCRTSPTLQNNIAVLTRSRSRFSGIDRQVIETLPFFKFSSLKGSKEGLECTVCLSKFEDSETLRLLPKCKHAFHMSCIDKWLESHSTCPLCRCKIEQGDIKSFTHYSMSSRSLLRVPSNLAQDSNLEIYVQREPSSSNRGSSRFSIGGSGRFWDVGRIKKQEFLIDHQDGGGTKWKKPVHKLNHRIVISDVVTRSRWSDLNSSDLISLSFEMLNDMSSTRFSHLEESTNGEKFHGNSSSLPSTSYKEENSFKALNHHAEKRSMSEIANVPRFEGMSKQNRVMESVAISSGENGRDHERLWRVWLPIARRTVQWFAKQEGNSSVELEHKPLASMV